MAYHSSLPPLPSNDSSGSGQTTGTETSSNFTVTSSGEPCAVASVLTSDGQDPAIEGDDEDESDESRDTVNYGDDSESADDDAPQTTFIYELSSDISSVKEKVKKKKRKNRQRAFSQ